MRVVFMGSAEIACEALTMLMDWAAVTVVGVVAQPDRKSGRKLQRTPCPAKQHAESLGVEIYTPDRVNTADAIAHIQSWEPDVGVVMAYGQILRPALLDIPRHGFLNIHTSLLPRYRGAAPIQRAIANGDAETGVSIMQMDAGMDTGDVLAMESTPIGEYETAGAVHARLAVMGSRLLKTALADWMEGRVVPQPQPTRGVTYAPKLAKQEGQIDWTQPARRLYNQIRGFHPWPCCYCHFDSGKSGMQVLRVLEARCLSGGYGRPGEVLSQGDRFVVACGEGALELVIVQPQGKSPMCGDAFLRGRRLEPGFVLG